MGYWATSDVDGSYHLTANRERHICRAVLMFRNVNLLSSYISHMSCHFHKKISKEINFRTIFIDSCEVFWITMVYYNIVLQRGPLHHFWHFTVPYPAKIAEVENEWDKKNLCHCNTESETLYSFLYNNTIFFMFFPLCVYIICAFWAHKNIYCKIFSFFMPIHIILWTQEKRWLTQDRSEWMEEACQCQCSQGAESNREYSWYGPIPELCNDWWWWW